jgi:hypothetical protein
MGSALCSSQYLAFLSTFVMKANIGVPNSVTYLNRTPIFDCYVVWCSSKNIYMKDTCLKEFGMCVETTVIILGLIIIKFVCLCLCVCVCVGGGGESI